MEAFRASGKRLLALRTRITARVPLVGDSCAVRRAGRKNFRSEHNLLLDEDATELNPSHLTYRERARDV